MSANELLRDHQSLMQQNRFLSVDVGKTCGMRGLGLTLRILLSAVPHGGANRLSLQINDPHPRSLNRSGRSILQCCRTCPHIRSLIAPLHRMGFCAVGCEQLADGCAERSGVKRSERWAPGFSVSRSRSKSPHQTGFLPGIPGCYAAHRGANVERHDHRFYSDRFDACYLRHVLHARGCIEGRDGGCGCVLDVQRLGL
jgi:hypothetical protein